MNSLVKAAPQGQTRTPISVLCVLATIRARTNVRPTATRDTSATMGLSGECYGQTPPGQGHAPHPPTSGHCISKVARHGLSQQNRGSPWGSAHRQHQRGLLPAHSPPWRGGQPRGCLTSAPLGSSLWPETKVSLSEPQCPHPRNRIYRAHGILSPCYDSVSGVRLFFFLRPAPFLLI